MSAPDPDPRAVLQQGGTVAANAARPAGADPAGDADHV